MGRTLVVLVVSALLVVSVLLMVWGTPAFVRHENIHTDILGRTVPDSTAERRSEVSGMRPSDVAASEAAGATVHTQKTLSQMGWKLGRGFVNASTGWLELPKTMYGNFQDGDPVFGDHVFGLALGSLYGLEGSVVRTVAGVYEAATFPVPMPARYAPVVDPPFVFPWEGFSLRRPR